MSTKNNTVDSWTPKQLAESYFTSAGEFIDTSNGKHIVKVKWQCRCKDVLVMQKNSGFTNLAVHVRHVHKDTYITQMSMLQGKNSIEKAFVTAKWSTGSCISKKAHDYCALMKWIINRNLPLSFCSQQELRDNGNFDYFMSINTLKKYIHRVSFLVKRIIKRELPPKIIIYFDGWKRFVTHYIAVIALYKVYLTEYFIRLLLVEVLKLEVLLLE